MVTWRERKAGVVYPAWLDDPIKLAVRRVKELNWGQETQFNLPEGACVVKRTHAGGYQMLVNGKILFDVRTNNPILEWLEKESGEAMDKLSDKALEFLKVLRSKGKVTQEEAGAYNATMRGALLKKGLIAPVGNFIVITKPGRDALNELPEFDSYEDPARKVMYEHVPQGDEMPHTPPSRGIDGVVTEMTPHPPAPLSQGRGGEDTSERVDNLSEIAQEHLAAYREADEYRVTPVEMVRLLLAEGIELGDVVQQVYPGEFSAQQLIIRLEIKEALARALYPKLNDLLETLGLVGFDMAIKAELSIILTQVNDGLDEIPW